MLKNYLKIAFRNLLRNKLYSVINIAGLAIGMAAAILILLWVTNELSYNKFNRNLDRIYIVPQTQHYQTIGDFTVLPTPMPLAQTLTQDYPEIQYAARYAGFGSVTLSRNNTNFSEQIDFTDSTFFRIFSFPFLEGDMETALTSPNSIVITRETANKFFGNEDPVGKTLRMDGRFDLKVTGVIADVPKTSDLQFDGLVPTDMLRQFGVPFTSWNNNMIWTFLLLRNPKQAAGLSNKISGLLIKHDNDPTTGKLFLYPFKDFHLYSYTGKGGRIQDVILFSMVALLILLIASINFMNLATARSARRATEVGVKKVVGATRIQIARQFFGESIIVALISLGLSLVIVEMFLPYFNQITDKSLKLGQIALASFLGILGITILTGVLAGIYPSVFLSSFKPVSMLKKTGSDVPGRFSLRRVLVVLQFAISIALIIGTTIVYLQLQFIHNKNIGMTLNSVVYFPATQKILSQSSRLENELKSDPNILSVTSARDIPINIGDNGGGWSWEGMPANQSALVSFTYGDYGYLKTFGMSLKAGRFFSPDHPSDDSTGVVINESFAKLIGKKSVVGMTLNWNHPYTVIGVVNDFNFQSLHEAVGPLAIFYTPGDRFMCVRVNNDNLPATISFIGRTCKETDPGFAFNYHFMDKTFEKMYVSEQRLGSLVGAFSILAVIIACLGLFGLSSYSAEVKRKEIGVRKVLGASVPNIIYLMSRELVSWVLIANVIAWPAAYYFMNGWLQTFAYRINISVWMFLAAAALALIIAAITTGYQALKAANADPVKSLRYE